MALKLGESALLSLPEPDSGRKNLTHALSVAIRRLRMNGRFANRGHSTTDKLSYQSRLTPFMPFLIGPGLRLYEFLITDGRQLCAMSRENFGAHVIWSPQISRRRTWMDHRRQEGRRGRSADHPERSRRDRSAHHPEWRSLGSQPGWDER